MWEDAGVPGGNLQTWEMLNSNRKPVDLPNPGFKPETSSCEALVLTTQPPYIIINLNLNLKLCVSTLKRFNVYCRWNFLYKCRDKHTVHLKYQGTVLILARMINTI